VEPRPPKRSGRRGSGSSVAEDARRGTAARATYLKGVAPLNFFSLGLRLGHGFARLPRLSQFGGLRIIIASRTCALTFPIALSGSPEPVPGGTAVGSFPDVPLTFALPLNLSGTPALACRPPVNPTGETSAPHRAEIVPLPDRHCGWLNARIEGLFRLRLSGRHRIRNKLVGTIIVPTRFAVRM
jgi:hypothetical protein